MFQISDFGLSKWKNYSRRHTITGKVKRASSHLSPEDFKIQAPVPNDKSDVFGFSILLWEMFTENKAYDNVEGKEMFRLYITHYFFSPNDDYLIFTMKLYFI